jgi:signal transduction histidine kinase
VPGSTTSSAMEELRAHNRALAELLAAKSDLVAMLLHRIRTPLTSLTGAVSLLDDEDGEVQAVVRRAAQRLNAVVEDIADLWALESGTRVITAQRLDIGVLVRAAQYEWRSRMPGGMRLTAAAGAGPMVSADPDLLVELLDRMISVAVATAGPDMVVALTAVPEIDHWSITVSVDGRMSADRLLTSTGDTDNAAALAFVRAILARHGGRLLVNSAEEVVRLEAILPVREPCLLG